MTTSWRLVLSHYGDGPYTAVTRLLLPGTSSETAAFPGFARAGVVEDMTVGDA